MGENIEPINPYLISIGPINIAWYGVILGCAVVVALLLIIREGKKHGYRSELFLDLLLFGVPAGIIGGRIYYVIFNWSYYAQNPGDIIAVWKGGLAIHGVIIAAVLVMIWFAKRKATPSSLSFWKLADMVAPSIIIAQAIGRWGNFMNQEAHGGPVSLEFLEGLRLPQFIINQMYIDGQYYHPTFLYESIWNVIVFIILISLRRLKLKVGELFLSYLALYSVGRFFIEGMRTDSLMLTDTLRMAQVISILLIIGAISLFIYRRKSGKVDYYWENGIHKK